MKRSYKKRYLDPTLDYSTIPKSTMRRWKREGKIPGNRPPLLDNTVDTTGSMMQTSSTLLNICDSPSSSSAPVSSEWHSPVFQLGTDHSATDSSLSIVENCYEEINSASYSSDHHEMPIIDDENVEPNHEQFPDADLLKNVYMFEKSKFTPDEVKTMLYCLSIRHNLSMEATKDFMDCVRVLAGWPKDSFGASEYMLKKRFEAPPETLKHVYYCDTITFYT